MSYKEDRYEAVVERRNMDALEFKKKFQPYVMHRALEISTQMKTPEEAVDAFIKDMEAFAEAYMKAPDTVRRILLQRYL